MGNCLRHESPMIWAGEDWGSPQSDMHFTKETRHIGFYDKARTTPETEEETLLGEKTQKSSSVPSSTEVKIRLTKKQLEELLGKVDIQGLSVQQVLAQLMNVSDQYHTQHRSWRPALQSIPEVN